MLHKDTLRYSLYIAVATVILALTAVFGKFEERLVVGDLSLSYVLVTLILGGAGYVTASLVQERGQTAMIVNGVVGSLIVGVALALLMVVAANLDITFVFPELTPDPLMPVLTFGQEIAPGLVTLLALSAGLGVVSALFLTLPPRTRQVILLSLGITTVIGLLESQVNQVITLPDGLALGLVFGAAYVAGAWLPSGDILSRLAVGAGIGAAAGLAFGLIANGGGLEPGGILLGAADYPRILGMSPGNAVLPLIIVFGIVGMVGALVTSAAPFVHAGAIYLVGMLLMLGVLNWQGGMTYLAGLLTLALFLALFTLIPPLNTQAESRFNQLNRGEQQTTQRLGALAALLVMIAAPPFMGQYITNVFDQVGLYVIMGIGLNIVVGYAGLLDLGYVAFFAIGAYTVGILTTPSLLTCGGVDPRTIPLPDVAAGCTGLMTFWQAWPLAIIVAGLAGILLGIPVLRLRGDYLAIVTLGFGEIIRLIVLSNDFKPLLGSAQGIPRIPGPVIDLTALNPAWMIDLGGPLTIYYLILASIILVAAITLRLVNTRLGRAWRAMRADEDVAQAMGINLVRTKLLAFGIGAAFAGMGGGIFGSYLQGTFPNSFTLLVSINVLSLIIIGGLGSIPGVVLGAMVLIGLPEILRELQDYRLMAFGILLVVTMLLKPEGLIPPPVRRLSEAAAEQPAKGEV